MTDEQLFPVPTETARAALVDDAQYQAMYAASLADPEAFWAEHEAEVENEDLEFIAACRLAQRRRLGPFRAPDKVGDFRQRDLAALARAG